MYSRVYEQIKALGQGVMPIMKRRIGGLGAACLLACMAGHSLAFETGEAFDAFQRKLSPTNTMTCHVRWSDLTGQPSKPGEEVMPFLFSYVDDELWFRGVNTGQPGKWRQGGGELVVASVEHLLERFGGRFMADQLAARGGDPSKRVVALDFVEAGVAVFVTMGETKSADQGQVVQCERYRAP